MVEAWCAEAGDVFMGVPDTEGSGENWWFPCEFGGVVYAECGGRLVVVVIVNIHVPGIESVNVYPA